MAGTLVIGLLGGLILGSRWSMLLHSARVRHRLRAGAAGHGGPDRRRRPARLHLRDHRLRRRPRRDVSARAGADGPRRRLRRRARGPARAGAARTSLGVIGWILTIIASARPRRPRVLVSPGRPRPSPVLGADGQPLPGSIAELTTRPHRRPRAGPDDPRPQRPRTRSCCTWPADPAAPTSVPCAPIPRLEDDFVVVTWDQRGTGKSYGALDPVETLTLEQMIADTIELTELPARSLRRGAHLPARQLVGLHARRARRAAAARPLPRLHRHRPDGQPARDRHHVLRGHPGLGGVDRRATPWSRRCARTARRRTTTCSTTRSRSPTSTTGTRIPSGTATRRCPSTCSCRRTTSWTASTACAPSWTPSRSSIRSSRTSTSAIDVPRLEVPVYMVVGAHEARGRAVLADEWFECGRGAVQGAHRLRALRPPALVRGAGPLRRGHGARPGGDGAFSLMSAGA